MHLPWERREGEVLQAERLKKIGVVLDWVVGHDCALLVVSGEPAEEQICILGAAAKIGQRMRGVVASQNRGVM